MSLRQYPRLERESRCEWRNNDELFAVHHHTRAAARFLPARLLLPTRFLSDDVAIDAAFFLIMIIARALQLFHHLTRHDGHGDQLRMRMLHGRARRLAMILEDQHILEPRVI